MPERYSKDKAWEESLAMKDFATRKAESESHPVEGADYEMASQFFDHLRKISPEQAARRIKEIARAYEERNKLGPEGFRVVSEVGDEVIKELWPKLQTIGRVIHDPEVHKSPEEIEEEVVIQVAVFVREIRNRVIIHPRVRAAFVGREEVLDELFGDEELQKYEDWLKKMTGIKF